MRSIRPYAWITAALLTAALLVLLLHLSTTGEEFSRYNIGWTGTSDFFAGLDRHTVTDIRRPADLAGAAGTLVIIAPDRQLTTAEAAGYRAFVERGNTLLLADDFGTGTAFLSAIGSTITIRQGNLSSVDRARADPAIAVVRSETDTPYLPAGTPLVLDRAASLGGGEPLLQTSVFSWVDRTADGNLTGGEALGRYTVMAEERIGRGTVYVIADPSIFINGMTGAGEGNRLFRAALARSPLLIDTAVSRAARAEGIGEIIHSVRTNDQYKFLIAALLMAGILAAWHRRIL